MDTLPEEGSGRLEGRKYVEYGGGAMLCAGLSLMLYPLTVIKTIQMATPPDLAAKANAGALRGFRGVGRTVGYVSSARGFTGFYRGIGTVVLGAFPARLVYLSALEATKLIPFSQQQQSSSESTSEHERIHALTAFGSTPTGENKLAERVAANSDVARAFALLTTLVVTVPVDVVSQRLMLRSRGDTRYANGWQLAAHIVRNEGLTRGLYRGSLLSIATFVPSYAIWLASFNASRSVLCRILSPRDLSGHDILSGDGNRNGNGGMKLGWAEVAAQIGAAAVAGVVTAVVSTPVDVVKVRLQVQEAKKGAERPRFVRTAKELVQADGLRGLYRGLIPRLVSMVAWGTCMVLFWRGD